MFTFHFSVNDKVIETHASDLMVQEGAWVESHSGNYLVVDVKTISETEFTLICIELN